MLIDGYKITTFTKLSEKICFIVLKIIEKEFGEIGDFCIEDNEVSFRVYKQPFEESPSHINENGIMLKLIDKFEYNFSLCYSICLL